MSADVIHEVYSASYAERRIYAELVIIARASDKPRIDFVSAFGKRNWGAAVNFIDRHDVERRLIASVPLFDGMRTRGRVAQAETDVARLTLEEVKLRDAVALEVQTAVSAAQEAGEVVTALTETVAQAQRLVFLSEKGYELGVKTRLEVQDAELNLLTAKSNLARAQRDYRVSRVMLEWVAGTLSTGAPAP